MADGKSYERAKAFRKALTAPEARLWLYLKARKLRGLRFRKQHPRLLLRGSRSRG